MALIGEPGPHCDLGQGIARFTKKSHRPLDPHALNVRRDGAPEDSMEEPSEVDGMNSGSLRKARHANRGGCAGPESIDRPPNVALAWPESGGTSALGGGE